MRTKLVLFVIVFSFVFNGLKAQLDVGDSLALVDLYNSTGGAGWTNHTNWLTKKPVSTWYGINVNAKKVTTIALGYNNLSGGIPTTIGNFDSLVILALNGNQLTGTIPVETGNLFYLQQLILSFNKLIGTLPESLGNCSQLSIILISYNKLTGTLPNSFKKLKQLTELYFSGNQLSGELPDVFADSSRLTRMDVSNNFFSGHIPSFLTRLPNLYYLNLAGNQFTGQIPIAFLQMTGLNTLDISANRISGNIPKGLADLPRLQFFYATGNELTETFNPQPTGKTDAIKDVYVDNNCFTFNGLEYLANTYTRSVYNPQKHLTIHQFQNGLAVSAGGTLAKNTYTWLTAGKNEKTVKEADSTFQPTESGQYYARIRNSSVLFLTLLTDTFTYIKPLNKAKPIISLSPNPARGLISIHGLNEKSDAKITIADMNGYVWVRALSRQQSTLKVDVSRLKAGNYLVNVSDGNEVKTIQFVKE